MSGLATVPCNHIPTTADPLIDVVMTFTSVNLSDNFNVAQVHMEHEPAVDIAQNPTNANLELDPKFVFSVCLSVALLLSLAATFQIVVHMIPGNRRHRRTTKLNRIKSTVEVKDTQNQLIVHPGKNPLSCWFPTWVKDVVESALAEAVETEICAIVTHHCAKLGFVADDLEDALHTVIKEHEDHQQTLAAHVNHLHELTHELAVTREAAAFNVAAIQEQARVEILNAEQHVINVNAELQIKDAEIAKLRTQVAAQGKDVKELANEITATREEAAGDIAANKEHARVEIFSAKQHVVNVDAKLQLKETEIANVHTQLAAQDKRVDELTNELVVTREEAAVDITTIKENARVEIVNARQRASAELQLKDAEIANLHTQVAAHEKQVNELANEIIATREESNAKFTTIEEHARVEIFNAEQNIISTNVELRIKDAEMLKLRAQVATRDKETKELTKEMIATREESNVKTLAIEERTRVEIANVNVTLRFKSAENADLLAEIAALKAALALRDSEQEMATIKSNATGDLEAADSPTDTSNDKGKQAETAGDDKADLPKPASIIPLLTGEELESPSPATATNHTAYSTADLPPNRPTVLSSLGGFKGASLTRATFDTAPTPKALIAVAQASSAVAAAELPARPPKIRSGKSDTMVQRVLKSAVNTNNGKLARSMRASGGPTLASGSYLPSLPSNVITSQRQQPPTSGRRGDRHRLDVPTAALTRRKGVVVEEYSMGKMVAWND